MLNLYWKIFLGFWVTSVILVGGAVYVNQSLGQSIPAELLGLTPEQYLSRTRFIIKRIPDDLPNWRQQLSRQDIRLYTIKSQSRLTAQNQTPDDIASVVDALDATEFVIDKTFTRVRIGNIDVDDKRQAVKIVLDMPNAQLLRLKEISRHISVQLALALIVSGFVCFFLARYLTRNIQKLSFASRALAKGDLSARVPLPARRANNDELFKLGSDFNHMADKLEQSIVNQRRLVRDISHELRSPLARLQIALELARQRNNSKELDRIESECNRLNELIGQILSIPDEFGPLEDVIDLCALINNVIDTCEIEAESRSVRINYTTQLS
ncbi:HAMP domain-containing protein, partial [bacterium]|nr:HAMP domain-containing protein [bacterium]